MQRDLPGEPLVVAVFLQRARHLPPEGDARHLRRVRVDVAPAQRSALVVAHAGEPEQPPERSAVERDPRVGDERLELVPAVVAALPLHPPRLLRRVDGVQRVDPLHAPALQVALGIAQALRERAPDVRDGVAAEPLPGRLADLRAQCGDELDEVPVGEILDREAAELGEHVVTHPRLVIAERLRCLRAAGSLVEPSLVPFGERLTWPAGALPRVDPGARFDLRESLPPELARLSLRVAAGLLDLLPVPRVAVDDRPAVGGLHEASVVDLRHQPASSSFASMYASRSERRKRQPVPRRAARISFRSTIP